MFPGGEPHFRLRGPVAGPATITLRAGSFADMGLLLVATDALRRAGVEEVHLVIPYFPAARQDRVMVPGEALTVKVYADLVNGQGYRSVTVFDPHSDVTPALIARARAVPNHGFVARCLEGIAEPYSLVSPDGGALKKIDKLAAYLGGADVVECSKRRDVATGALTDFIVYADALDGRTCVVVDDIIDGGGTFLGLASALKARGAGRLYLIASHGIFSKGADALAAVYEKIFTTDSVRTLEHPGVVTVPVQTFLTL